MILSDSAILKSIEDEQLVIKNCREDYLQNTSWDIRLGKNLFVVEVIDLDESYFSEAIIDPKNKDSVNYQPKVIDLNGGVIYPNKLYLGVTTEYFEFNKGLAGTVDGVSSLGRLGVSVHQTAGYCDEGFKGHVTLEITTVYPFILYPNMIIGQMVFKRTEGDVTNPYNKKKINYCNECSDNPYPIPSNYHLKFDK